MNEDPTRLMDYGDEPPRRRRPPQNQPKGNLRLVVLVMGVVIFGLLIGLLASCGGGSTKTVTVTKEITEEVTVPANKETAQEKEEGAEGAEGAEGEEAEGGEVEEVPEEETGGLEEENFLPEELEEGGEIEEAAPEVEEELPPEETGGGVESE